MVFSIEFNHEFYYVESPFYFWDFFFKALNFRVLFLFIKFKKLTR